MFPFKISNKSICFANRLISVVVDEVHGENESQNNSQPGSPTPITSEEQTAAAKLYNYKLHGYCASACLAFMDSSSRRTRLGPLQLCRGGAGPYWQPGRRRWRETAQDSLVSGVCQACICTSPSKAWTFVGAHGQSAALVRKALVPSIPIAKGAIICLITSQSRLALQKVDATDDMLSQFKLVFISCLQAFTYSPMTGSSCWTCKPVCTKAHSQRWRCVSRQRNSNAF